MTIILWVLGSIVTFGLLTVVLTLYAASLAATNFDSLELQFEDGEGW